MEMKLCGPDAIGKDLAGSYDGKKWDLRKSDLE